MLDHREDFVKLEMSKETSGAEKMSPATKDVIAKVKQIVPPMLERFHKGKLTHSLTFPESCTNRPLQANSAEWASLEVAKIILEHHTSRLWPLPVWDVIWYAQRSPSMASIR